MNWLDNAISWISPERGLKRARARYVASLIGRRYEAASIGRRTDGWVAVSNSANTEISGALVKLRDRHRDLVRNNPYAARAISGITYNTIGTGITPHVLGKTEKETRAWEELLREHLDTAACDADGLHNLYGLEALAMRTVVEAGEAIVRRRRRLTTDGLPLPVQFQVMEPDFIDSSKEGKNGANTIKHGIEFSPIGRRVAYWLFQSHPGDSSMSYRAQSSRVPAEDILHIYRVDRAGQIRGVPWGAPIMLRLHDLDEYEDAQLMRQKIAACFAVFVHDGGIDSAVPDSTTGKYLEALEPGVIEHLPAGKSVSFASPPGVDGHGEFVRISLQAVAAGYGVTYEMLTGDLTGANFSRSRMGWMEFQRNIDAWRHQMFIPQFCLGIQRWVIEAALLAKGMRAPIEFTWATPKREMIDPTKEIPMYRDAMRAGIMTPSQVVRERGEDPDKHFAEWQRDAERFDQLGLTFDSDPRRDKGPVNTAEQEKESDEEN